MKFIALALFFWVEAYAWQPAIVTADYAVVYSDDQLSSPIGKISRGREIKIGNVLRRHQTVATVSVSGKLAFIEVKDLVINPKENHKTAESIEASPQPKITEHFVFNDRFGPYVGLQVGKSNNPYITFGTSYGADIGYRYYAGSLEIKYKRINTEASAYALALKYHSDWVTIHGGISYPQVQTAEGNFSGYNPFGGVAMSTYIYKIGGELFLEYNFWMWHKAYSAGGAHDVGIGLRKYF